MKALWLGLYLAGVTATLKAAPAVQLAPELRVLPGKVLVCRLLQRPLQGAILAGFGQGAGFYFSPGEKAWVALLAVPLNQKAGRYKLWFKAPQQASQVLPVRVLKDHYPLRRLRVRHLKSRLRRAARTGDQEMLVEVRARVLEGPPLWAGSFRWPLDGPVHPTAAFGTRRSYNQGQAAWRHKGLDLRAAPGTLVLAPNDGVVALARLDMALSGGTVILNHGYGLSTSYFHLSQVRVSVGQFVKKGQVLGASGNTGLSAGPHLHWQMELHHQAVDPGQWIPEAPNPGKEHG